ncbi:MAG: SDR family NAD(P)-dependent oxidoreductase [Planctomycetota bacterium]
MLSGSTGGIGIEIAKLLASQGWNLVLVNRSGKKSEQQAADLLKEHPEISVTCYTADLLDQSAIIKASEDIRNDHVELNALYNIAGLLTDKRITSLQGVEGHFAVNTVAPFLFARELNGLLTAGGKTGEHSVVVNFSSSAVNSVKRLNPQTLIEPADIGGLMGAYANCKLALMAMTLAMNSQSEQSRVLFQSVDPGPTRTPMTKSGDGMPWFLRLLVPFIFKAPEVQAKRLVDGVQQAVRNNESGLYISEGRRKPYPGLAMDRAFQRELMEVLDQVTKTSDAE